MTCWNPVRWSLYLHHYLQLPLDILRVRRAVIMDLVRTLFETPDSIEEEGVGAEVNCPSLQDLVVLLEMGCCAK